MCELRVKRRVGGAGHRALRDNVQAGCLGGRGVLAFLAAAIDRGVDEASYPLSNCWHRMERWCSQYGPL